MSGNDPADCDMALVPGGISEAQMPLNQREKVVDEKGCTGQTAEPGANLDGQRFRPLDGHQFHQMIRQEENVGESRAEPIEIPRRVEPLMTDDGDGHEEVQRYANADANAVAQRQVAV